MKILTCLDLSEYAEIVLEHGLDQAVRHPHADLHFATVIGSDRDREPTANWLVSTVMEGLETFGLNTRIYELHLPQGDPMVLLPALALGISADLVVIGRFSVPSTASALVKHLPCPVEIVGIDGVELEAQCADCGRVRIASGGERLFCNAHADDRMIDLGMRIGPSTNLGSRLW